MSAYAQLDYKPVEVLKLIVGIQVNKPHKGDMDIVPRLGAILNLGKEFGIKALYGQAFRSPSPVEINIFVRNLFDEDYYFTEFARGWVNTLPMGPGRTIYAGLTIGL
ncbi:MAG: TonB-dependent receptor [bacterium]|nr:TonB-dependent receptor [bacterium]